MLSTPSAAVRLAFSVLLAGSALAYGQATTLPSKIDVGDLEAIRAAKGKEVLVEGVCSRAQWSKSGKVMNIEFKGVDRTKFIGVVFEKQKAKFDEAFMGDAAKDFTGAKLRLRGRISEYDSAGDGSKGVLEIILSDTSAVTIVEPATNP